MTGRRVFGTVRKLPSGRWQVRYWDAARRRVTAPETFERKGDAQRHLATIEADQLRGVSLDPRAGRVTVERWAEEWLSTKRGQRSATLARDRAALRHALPILGRLPVAKVTPGHVRQVVDAMRAAGLSTKSIRTYVGTLAGLFGAAVDAELIGRSPVRTRTLNLGTVERRDRPTLTPNELLRLADEVGDRYSALVLVAGVLGLRWGEAVALRVSDVDFLRRTLTVAQTVEEVAGVARVVATTKTEAGRRTMTVPPFLVEALAAHLTAHRPGVDRDELIFVGPKGGLLRRSFCARILRPAATRAGLPESLTFHGLRHVATSLMVASGEHPKVIQTRLGHADPALSMGLYAHVPDELDQAAAGRLAEQFSSAVGTRWARNGA